MANRTFFASAERDDAKQVLADMQLIQQEKNVCEILNSLPNVVLILNQKLQIVFANELYSDSATGETIADKLGVRPGELFGCIYSLEESSGCGTARSCRFCSLVLTILESQKTGKKVSNEARLMTGDEGEYKSFDFQATAAPIKINKKKFILLTLDDISAGKRKDILERIFFHDILNKAGSLNSLFEGITSHTVGDKAGKLLEVASDLSNEIVEEINTHRSILEAEKGELTVTKTKIFSKVVLESVVKQINCHTVAYEKIIIIHPDAENLNIYTDYYLIIRVVINMMKNALEATSRQGIVVISCNRKNNDARFWVHNNRYFDEEVAQQIFHRSFSTKGRDRGLGTYSMKLIGENYLGGRISFESSKEKGTTFYFDLPIVE
jgi:hypothetical protein